jgi:hypothetical protein
VTRCLRPTGDPRAGRRGLLLVTLNITSVILSCQPPEEQKPSPDIQWRAEFLQELVSPNTTKAGHFGISVSDVPDLDGDGTDDAIFGAARETFAGGPDWSGRAYVFSGRTGKLIWELQSPNPKKKGLFGGVSVGGVPDLDGDGRGDLLVTAKFEDVEISSGTVVEAGRVYVLSGGTGELLHTLESPRAQERGHFGSWVTGLPDTDGDGFGDFVVGAYTEDSPSGGKKGKRYGRVYLYSGSTGTVRLELQRPEQSPPLFGRSVSVVPDADGDGIADVVVGAVGWAPAKVRSKADLGNPKHLPTGAAYIFSGATGEIISVLNSPTPRGFGEFEGLAKFGQSVSGVEDVDGDGLGDVVVGAEREDVVDGPVDAGRAYVFKGNTGALLYTLASPNEQANGLFGRGVAGVPDVDGDGRGEIAVGAWLETVAPSAEKVGRAYLFSGATGALLVTIVSPNEVADGRFSGFPVSGISNPMGDGRGGLLVGAEHEHDVYHAGRAYIVGFSVEPDQ